VLSSDGDVARVVVGEPEAAHHMGRSFWDAHFQVPLEERADVVIASAGGHPKDINLYQAYKGQYNAARAVRNGGIIYLAAACRDGIGHDVFTDWIARSPCPDDVLRILEQEGFKLGGHKAVYLANDRMRAELLLQSELDDDLARRFFYAPVSAPGDALELAQEKFGKRFRVLVMPHAADTFPVLSGD
jgi:nickel-dependent lactate racemase